MLKPVLSVTSFALISFLSLVATAGEIRMARDPDLSPDGKTLIFSYRQDIWRVGINGGRARRLTTNAARESSPRFSPDGKQIAFISNRDGSRSVYVMRSNGGLPKRLTYHSDGFTSIDDWYSDGSRLLLAGSRDHFWRRSERFLTVSAKARSAEQLAFDAYGSEASLSPDGKRILFVREGERSWRKGYRGARAAQIWMYKSANNSFQELLHEDMGCRSPLWKPDGNGFYYTSERDGVYNLWEYSLKNGKSTQLTAFEDDSVLMPCLSRDGSTIVFRHLFDFYRLSVGKKKPQRLRILEEADDRDDDIERLVQQQATDVAFTNDGLEIAFVAGGELWVMDTELKEPHQVTATPGFESDPVFSADGDAIYFVSIVEGQSDIWKATRSDPRSFWWQNDSFKLERITQDPEPESDLTLSPNGKQIAYVRGNGELWLSDLGGKNAKRILHGFDPADFAFSPDGRWIVYTQSDNDFNRDVWLIPVDGSKKPFNLSRHPDVESNPVWSPDGRLIAFTGRRRATEVDIYYVWLRAEDEDQTSRDRRLKKAIEKATKGRKKPSKPSVAKSEKGDSEKPKSDSAKSDNTKDKTATKKPIKVVIDFDGIHERLHRISIPDSSEFGLLFAPDGKKLSFGASVKGQRGTYTVEIPDSLQPKLLTPTFGSGARWLKSNTIAWLANGVPGTLTATGKATSYPFRAYQSRSRSKRFREAFDLCWRTMRDWYYDDKHGNNNWNEIRRKYRSMAEQAADLETLTDVVHLMLGELNGSHLGFRARGNRSATSNSWSITTAHLGVRFDNAYKGPGLKVRDVLPNGPAAKAKAQIKSGEIIVRIDGQNVDPGLDLTKILNGRSDRNIELVVRDAKNNERKVMLRPTSYSTARRLLYTAWLEHNRQLVDKQSKGRLGYLHIQLMNLSSFLEFERQLYAAGSGRDGLVIDVRENGGGSTTDHLLTCLTQPRHAITVPRGGGQGYPQDRMIYATWSKPIIVLCNQNSFSNAEIFSHAIKNLKRGKLVGVTTAGSVISTGSARIMDVGTLRRPFRGWFVKTTGEDMELNGAQPDFELWPVPGQLPAGKDIQLNKAIVELMKEMKATKKKEPKLRKATDRKTK